MNVTIVDYNSGNISSVINSFKEAAKDKVKIEVTSNLNKIKSSDKLVLPGQGSFKSCVDAKKSPHLISKMKIMKEQQLIQVIQTNIMKKLLSLPRKS